MTPSTRRVLTAVLAGQRHHGGARIRVVGAQRGERWSSSFSSAASVSSTNATQPQSRPHSAVAAAPTTTTAIANNLARVYEILESQVGGEEEWSARVQKAMQRLATTTTMTDPGNLRTRVAVYSDDVLPSTTSAAGAAAAAAGNVVTSLLLDPFAEDEPTRLAITQRHSEPHAGGEYVIRYAEKTAREIDSLSCNSPWLRDANVDLVEIISKTPQQAISSVLESDVILLILDPIRLLDTPRLPALVRELEHKRGVYFIVDGELPGAVLAPDASEARTRVEERLREQLGGLWGRSGNGNGGTGLAAAEGWPKTLFMHSERGISAIHSLRRVISLAHSEAADARPVASAVEDVQSRAFREFQERYVDSNLGDVSQSLIADIRGLAAGVTTNSEQAPAMTSPTTNLQTRTAEHVLLRSLHYIDSVLTSLTAHSLRVRKQATALREAAEDEERDIVLLASTTWRRSLQTEMQRTRDAVARVLGQRFGGWRVLTGRAERVEEEVAGQVVVHWGYALTQQLAFDTGRLEQIHRSLSQKTDTLLRSFAALHSSSTTTTTPFYSPILINSLSQLEQTHQITPAALTSPIHARRTQLLSFVVPALQKRAYTTAYTAWSLVFASTSLSWTACVPLDLLDPASSLGVGLLGSMAAFRWAVGAWQRAQKKFWADWERVEAGLEHDLGRDLSEVVQGRVVAKAFAGADGLEALVKKRMARVDEVDAKVNSVRQSL